MSLKIPLIATKYTLSMCSLMNRIKTRQNNEDDEQKLLKMVTISLNTGDLTIE